MRMAHAITPLENPLHGEVRKYNSYYGGIEKAGEKHFDVYRVARQK